MRNILLIIWSVPNPTLRNFRCRKRPKWWIFCRVFHLPQYFRQIITKGIEVKWEPLSIKVEYKVNIISQVSSVLIVYLNVRTVSKSLIRRIIWLISQARGRFLNKASKIYWNTRRRLPWVVNTWYQNFFAEKYYLEDSILFN